MDRVPVFNGQQLTAITKIIGDTDRGLTGKEIGHVLPECRIPDVSPEMTKWKRLYNALAEIQNAKQVGNHTVMVINRVMNPVQYTNRPDVFATRRDELNTVLAFCGFTIGEDGRVRRITAASNLRDAMERASRLHGAPAKHHTPTLHDPLLLPRTAKLRSSFPRGIVRSSCDSSTLASAESS